MDYNIPHYKLFFVDTIKAQSLHQYVDPMIGSEGLGRFFIGPSYPFGMVKPGPDYTSSPNSGWKPHPAPITGFSQTHVSGTGGGPKYGNIQIMPFSGALKDLDHSSLRSEEEIKLGYYKTVLENNNIETEITTGEKISFFALLIRKINNKL